jgi:hypothetical protein
MWCSVKAEGQLYLYLYLIFVDVFRSFRRCKQQQQQQHFSSTNLVSTQVTMQLIIKIEPYALRSLILIPVHKPVTVLAISSFPVPKLTVTGYIVGGIIFGHPIWGSSVSIVTRLRAGRPRFCYR